MANTSTLLSVSVGYGKCCFLSNVLHTVYKLLETLAPNPRLLLGWSKGPENAREPESQLHLDALHPYKVTPALLRKSPPWGGSSARAFRLPLPEPQLENILEGREAGREASSAESARESPARLCVQNNPPGGRVGKVRTHPSNTGTGARRPALEDEGASR